MKIKISKAFRPLLCMSKAFIGIYFTAFLIPLPASFHPNLLLNGYVCAFTAVRWIAQWRDRYRLLKHEANEQTSVTESVRERKRRTESAGKLKTLLCFVLLSNEFSLKPYIQFGFWFSRFKLRFCRCAVQILSAVCCCRGKRRARKRQSKCEFCVLLSVGLLYDIN